MISTLYHCCPKCRFLIYIRLLSILLADCTVVIIILVAGINSLRTNELLKMQLDPDEAKRVIADHNLAL